MNSNGNRKNEQIAKHFCSRLRALNQELLNGVRVILHYLEEGRAFICDFYA